MGAALAGLLGGLATLAGPIVARVLIALGMSVVSVTGVNMAFDQIKRILLQNLAAGPSAGLQLAGLAGVWEGLGIVLGGVAFALSFWALTQSTKIIGAAAPK